MPNETLSSSFPASQQDVNNLAQTARNAAQDLGSSASDYGARAKGQLQDLSGHLQQEGGDQIERVKSSLGEVVASARGYAVERPFQCIGVALAVGFLFGLLRGGNSRSED